MTRAWRTVLVAHATPQGELLTIEAMKMLTALVAPRAGTVVEVLVRPDDFVEQDAILLRLR